VCYATALAVIIDYVESSVFERVLPKA